MTKQSASAKARKKPKAQVVDGGGTADDASVAAADGGATVAAAGAAGANEPGAAVRVPAQKGEVRGAAAKSSGGRGQQGAMAKNGKVRGAEGAQGGAAKGGSAQSVTAKNGKARGGAQQNAAAAAAAGGTAGRPSAKGGKDQAADDGLPGSTRQALGGWLEGPNLHDGDAGGYRGERLGLPESGSGALAGQGRRLGALLVDWLIAYLITKAIGWHPSSSQGAWGVLAVFAAEHLLLVSLLGYTIGKRIFGMRIGRLGGPLSPMAVVIRTLLLLLVIPAAVWDRDGRGLHDRIAGTVEVLR